MRFETLLKKILVPTDGSNASLAAHEAAADVAKVFSSRVTVIHVIPQQLASLENEYAWLVTGRGQIPQGGAYRSSEIAPPDLIRRARDLAVLGRGEDDGKEPHLGSTAEKVGRHSEIPVLIVGSTTHITKTLVCFDGSQSAEKALQYAAHLAKNLNAKMTIIHVHHPELLRSRPEQAEDVESCILSRASEILVDIAFETRTETGDPARVIIETARTEKCDLIVMGSKGHSGIERFLLGSASEHVIHYTDTSVLLVR